MVAASDQHQTARAARQQWAYLRWVSHAKTAGKEVAVRGLNALAAAISTPLAAPVIAATRLRGGNAASVRGAAGFAAAAVRTAYLEWAARSVRMLNYQLSEANVASLVLTRRCELLLSRAGTLTSGDAEVQRIVNSLVSLELDERVGDLDKALRAARSYQGALDERRRPGGVGH